jgi:hypothetical protein
MNAQPALNNLIKAPACAGRRINFNDNVVMITHDGITTNVDRKHGSE